ncbi:mitochondrial ornithine carrier protein [Thecaphora frezii]
MLAMKPGEVEMAAPLAQSMSPKAPRWGNLKQRLSSSVNSRDSVDDEMWDKNDTAFLQEVARDSPMICADVFDTLTPLEAGFARPSSISSPRLSVDHLYRTSVVRPSSSNTATSTASFASSSNDDIHVPKVRTKPTRRRGSSAVTATAASATLPDLPEQPRPEFGLIVDDNHAGVPPPELLSSPTHTSAHASSRSSPSSSSACDSGDGASQRPLAADQYPRSPSLHDSPSPSLGVIGFRPGWDDRSYETRSRSNSLAFATSNVVKVHLGSGPIGDEAATLVPGHSPALKEAVEDDVMATSPRSHFSPVSQRGPASPVQASKQAAPVQSARRRSIISLLASPQKRESRWAEGDDHVAASEAVAPQSAPAGPSFRKHHRSSSSLIAGFKKLIGKKDREYKPEASTGLPGVECFCMPFGSSLHGSRRIVENVQIVGPLTSEDGQARGLNLVGVPLDVSSPVSSPQKTIRAARRSPSVDLLRSLGNTYAGPATLQGSFAAASPLVDSAAVTGSRAKSSDGLGRPFGESMTHQLRVYGIVGNASSRAQARSSVIEHISYDEARKTTGSAGPVILKSRESLEELRSHSRPPHGSERADGAPVLLPVRPCRPSSAQSSQGSADVLGSAATSAAAASATHTNPRAVLDCFGFQPQVYKPPLHHGGVRQAPSSPSFLSLGSQLIDNSSSDGLSHAYSSRMANSIAEGGRLVHGSRRSLGSLGARPWSNLLGSPILSSSGSSSSHHKRLSAASISRPLSVASSAFSDTNEIAADMHHLTVSPRARFDSNASESMLGRTEAASPRSGQGPRARRVGAAPRRPMTSGSMTPSSPASTARFESPLQRSSSAKAFHNGSGDRGQRSDNPTIVYEDRVVGGGGDTDHSHRLSSHDGLRSLRTMSTASFSHRKRPSFGLAIEPAASSAFDSIPSPLLRTRRPSAPEADASHPHSPRPRAFEDDDVDVEHQRDQPAASMPEAVSLDSISRFSSIASPELHGEAAPPQSFLIHSIDEEVQQGGRLSQATKDLAFGSIAGMFSKVFEHPFDLVKVRLQTQPSDQPPRYRGAFDCFRQTCMGEGVRGLYRGLSMPVFGASLENACLFFTYNRMQSLIRSVTGQQSTSASAIEADAETPLSFPQLAIAAAGAGAATSLVLTPIELIKCKMQVQMITRQQPAPSPSAGAASGHLGAFAAGLDQKRKISSAPAAALPRLDGPLTLLRRTIQADGIRGLWLGQTGTLLRETGGGVAWFLAFESCSRWFIERKKAQRQRDDISKKDLTSLELVGAGALAGISYNVVLFPADSVKSTMQTEQEMRGPPRPGEAPRIRTGFFQTFRNIYRTRGVKGLYAGCGVTCLRSAPSSALIFLMVNKLEQAADRYGI